MAAPVVIPRPERVNRSQGAKIARSVQRDVGDEHIKILRDYTDTQAIQDPFKNIYNSTGSIAVVEPSYNPASLIRLPDENNTLRQCIAAMVTNVVGHGYRLEFKGDTKKQKPDSPQAEAEKQSLENLIDRPNVDMTFSEFRARIWEDREATGNAYIEVGRDAKGRVVMLNHVPSDTIRLTQRDSDATPVPVELMREGKLQKYTVQRRFRRFIQMVGAKRVYFKEFGDPRKIDPATGEVNDALPFEQTATEIYHLHLYNPRSPYGIPRWIGQLPSILGSRQAELTNLDFFNENAVPALALLVAGGTVPQETIDQIESNIAAARGRSSMNRVLIIEVESDPRNAAENGQIPAPNVELQPLAKERMTEGQFLEYIDKCSDNVRSAFRLPPLFIGKSEDMTYATAKTAFEVAESQVFSPERVSFDDFMNIVVLGSWQPKFWTFRSNPPRLTDKEEIIQALEAFSNLGALTPNIAIGLANEFFDMHIEEVSEEWGNWPFPIVLQLATQGDLIGLEKIMMDMAEKEKRNPVTGVGPDGKPLKPGATPDGSDPKNPAEPAQSEGGGKAKPKAKKTLKPEIGATVLGALAALRTAYDETHEDEEAPAQVHVEV